MKKALLFFCCLVFGVISIQAQQTIQLGDKQVNVIQPEDLPASTKTPAEIAAREAKLNQANANRKAKIQQSIAQFGDNPNYVQTIQDKSANVTPAKKKVKESTGVQYLIDSATKYIKSFIE